jgi:hypothetical protein
MVMLLVIVVILGLLYACIQDEKERRKFFLLVSIMGAVSLFLWLCAIMGIVSVGSNALSAMATLFFVRFARAGGKTKEKLQLGSMLSVMLLGLSACFSANDKDIYRQLRCGAAVRTGGSLSGLPALEGWLTAYLVEADKVLIQGGHCIMLKKILMTVMSVALLLGGYCGSASAEYVHVFHVDRDPYNTWLGDGWDCHIDFAGIQSSPVQWQDKDWTRYIVPVISIEDTKEGSKTTYEKWIFMNNGTDEIWYSYYTVRDHDPNWYDVEDWDRISMDDIASHEGEEVNYMQLVSPAQDLNNVDYGQLDFTFHNYAAILYKVLQYEAGVITGNEPVYHRR